MAAKKRTAKQIAATKRLVARNKRLAREKRLAASGKKPAAKRSPVKAAKRAATRVASAAKQRGYIKTTTTKRKKPMAKKKTVGARLADAAKSSVVPVAAGAGGALAANAAVSNLPIPAEYQTGHKGSAARALVGVVAGGILEALGMTWGRHVAIGAATVSIHESVKAEVTARMPSIKLNGLENVALTDEEIKMLEDLEIDNGSNVIEFQGASSLAGANDDLVIYGTREEAPLFR